VTRRVVVRSGAQRDLSRATVWYERQQNGLGGLFLDSIDRLLDRISSNPWQFPEVESGVRRGLLGRFPYGVYFVVDPTHIDIIAILHLQRNPQDWKRRM